MGWFLLDSIQMGGNSLDDWTASSLSGISQELIKVSWEISSTNFQYLQSKILLRRKWNLLDGTELIEKAQFLYPSLIPIVLYLEIPSIYNLAGLETFKIEVKRIARFRYYGLFEPDYSIKIEIYNN